LRGGIMAEYAKSLPTAVKCFDDGFEACIAHLRLPVTHRRSIRTTNLIERLFGEERRRLKIVPNAFGEKPVLKLMFGALIRAAESWRGFHPCTSAGPRTAPRPRIPSAGAKCASSAVTSGKARLPRLSLSRNAARHYRRQRSPA
jgi:hypothetical protein